MPDRCEKDRVRLLHILDACRNIEAHGKSGERDLKTYQAIERNIQIIGEASRAVSPELKTEYPDIPWKNIIGFRNILVHEYFIVNEPKVWDVAEHKIPALRNWVEGILKDLEIGD